MLRQPTCQRNWEEVLKQCTVCISGDHKIQIFYDGEEIEGSPFRVSVHSFHSGYTAVFPGVVALNQPITGEVRVYTEWSTQ